MAKSKKIERISSVDQLTYIQDTICQIRIERIEAAVNSIRKDSTITKLMRTFSNLNNIFAEEEERYNNGKKRSN